MLLTENQIVSTHFPGEIFTLQQLFFWLQKEVLDLIYQNLEENFDLAHFPTPDFVLEGGTPKITKNGQKMPFLPF